MESSYIFLLTIGGILLLGLITSAIGHRTFLPRATLLLLLGIIIGQEALNIIPTVFAERFDLIADITLVMVGFLLGGKLTVTSLRQSARQVLWISITAALVTTLLVTLSLYFMGISLQIAILLGCIASATAPAAILDVVQQYSGSTRFKDLLLSIVAIDDVWALILFAVGIAVVTSLNGSPHEVSSLMLISKDIGVAVAVGVMLGLPAAYLTGRIKPGQPILTEALALVFLCGGLALWLDASFLVASMVMGAIIANLARHHEYPFHAIESIESPLMVIFFVLAGAQLEFDAVMSIGVIGLVYLLSRAVGKILGAWLGSLASDTDVTTRRWLGMAMLPQAGVPIGMALVAANQFPEYRQTLLTLVISSTVIFEITGPLFTRLALSRSQQA